MYYILELKKINKKTILFFVFLWFLQLGFSQSADFTINNASQCLKGNSFVFTNTSTAGATAYQWSFSDGTNSTATNPTKTYSNYGTYSVQLIATIGGINYYVNKTIEINAQPQCSFTYYAATGTGNSYSFQSTSSIGSGSMNYSWDFGDGGAATSSNPSHTYAANGTYTVTLTVTSDKNCTCSTMQTVVATVSSGGYSPNLSFSINSINQCINGNNFSFTNTTAAISGATYHWTFGDGNISSLANPTHSYTSAGSYSVSLIATIASVDYTYSQIVNVTTAPTISIAGTACTGSTLTATTNATNIASIVWKNGTSVVQTTTPNYNLSYTIVAGNNGAGTNANQLNVAKGIYVDKAGNVYVIDNFQSRVQKWAVGATTGITVATGLQITGVGVDDAGNVYTVDDINNWVQKWTSGSLTPTTVAGGNGSGAAANQLNNPRGNLYIDASGNIYINDLGNSRIQKWAVAATSGTTVAGGNGVGAAANQFNYAYSFFVDASGNTYVADLGNYRIQLWTVGATTGVTVAGGNGNGSAANQFDAGADLVFVDANGNIYEVDRFQGRIQYWAAGANAGITAFGGSYGSAPHDQPFVFVNTNNGDIYVLDQSNNRVLKYTVTNTINNTYATTTTGTYTATVTSFGGCTATSNSVIVNQTPTVYPIVGAYNVCANTTTTFVDTASLGGTWSSNNTSVATINASGVITGVGAGTATITYTVNNAGCTASVTKNITVFANPTITLTGGGACASAITASLTGGLASYLIWRLNGTPLDTVYNTNNTTHSVVGTGTYTVDIVTSDGCSSTASTVVSSVGVAPTIAINTGVSCGNVTICAGSNATFNSSITNGGASPTIQWKVNGSNVATGVSFTTSSLNNNDIVTAELTSNAVCPNPNSVTSNAITIAVKASPTATITGTACVGNTLSLGGSGLSGSTITWLVGGIPAAAAPSIDTNAVTVAGGLSSGNGASQLNNQQGIFVDNSNHLYIADFGNDRVQKWTISASTGNTVAGGNGQGLASNQTNGYGLFVDKNDNLYTVESLHRVQKWASGATSAVTIAGTGFAGNSAAQFTLPKSVYIDDCGNMYVADTYNHRVQKFSNGSTVGVTVAGTGISGNAATQLSYPTHVQVDAQGNIYVADNGNSRIQKFAASSLTATTVAGTGVAGNASNQLNNAWGMFVDGGGNIYVADTYNNRIMYWANGATIGVKIAGTGNYGSGANGLNYPTHIFVDANGNVYVSDSHNNRVQKFAAIAPASIIPGLAGTYTAIVSNAYGCSVTSNTINVTTCTVVTPPTPSFTTNATSQCLAGNNFVFTNTSAAPVGTTYSWNFGDNTSSSATSPTHTYITSGYFNVQMTATYNGQTYYANSQSIYVGAKPMASFNVVAGTGSGNAFTFISTSTINNGSMSYAWSFNDGATSTLVSPQHIYASTGTYNVKLVITSDLGCKDSIIQSITVTTGGNSLTPVPSFTTNTTSQCIAGNNFVFINTSTAPTGTIYNWNFGDNTFSTATNPAHTYTTSGYFNVQMIAHYNGQDYYANSQSIYIGAKPMASFNVVSGTGSGNAHTFISTSTITNGSMSYAWDFGDGTTSTLVSPQHIYSTAGTMNVKLVVTSDLGCKDSTIQAVVICPSLNNQAFSINSASSCFIGNYFGVQNYFGNSASYPMTYLWNYGDGTTSTLQNPPTHNYAAVGAYTISLTTTLSYPGCAVKTGTYSLPVTVYPMPVASFNISGSPTTMCYAANNYTFNNTTSITNGSMSFAWNFGDTTSSSLYSPSHSYTHAGSYGLDSNRGKIFIKLIATSDNNCKDSISKYVTLYPVPIASSLRISGYYGSGYDHPLSRNSGPTYYWHSSIPYDTIQCFNGYSWFGHSVNGVTTSPFDVSYFNFDDGSSDFGGGAFSHGSPYHIYTTVGNHPVSGYIKSPEGCVSNTVYSSVTLTPNTDTLPHSIIGLHPEVTTNAGVDPFGTSYNHYKLFFAHLGSTACRPIIAAYWRISYLSGNSYWNHGYYDAGPYIGLLPLTSDSVNFQFDADTTNTFQIRLITMNDLGMTDTAYATFGASNSGYTNYRTVSAAAIPNNIKAYPNPTINEVKVAVKLNKNTHTNLIVYNALGQRVLTTQQYLFGNVVDEIKLNIQQLQVGTYYVQIKDDENNILANTKFVKVK